MKVQTDDGGIIEVVVLARGQIRMSVGATTSVSLSPREARVVIALLEAAVDETLD